MRRCTHSFFVEKAERSLYETEQQFDSIRQLDSLVNEYPDTFHCIKETDISKTYEMSKTSITYRKPRKLSDEQREQARQRMKKINHQ